MRINIGFVRVFVRWAHFQVSQFEVSSLLDFRWIMRRKPQRKAFVQARPSNLHVGESGIFLQVVTELMWEKFKVEVIHFLIFLIQSNFRFDSLICVNFWACWKNFFGLYFYNVLETSIFNSPSAVKDAWQSDESVKSNMQNPFQIIRRPSFDETEGEYKILKSKSSFDFAHPIHSPKFIWCW